MASTSSSSSNSSDKPPTSPPTTTQQPPSKDLFNCIRRFTDHHIASVLHSLIGLPTMLPPPSSTWIMDDESARALDPPPPPTLPTSTIAEALKKDDDDMGNAPPSQSTRGRMAECFLLTDPRTTTPSTTLFRPEEDERLAAVWRQMRLLNRDFAAPFFGGDVWGTGMGKGGAGLWGDPFFIAPLIWSGGMERGLWSRRNGEEGEEGGERETELDAYNHLAPATTTTSSSIVSSSTYSSSSQQQSEDPNRPQVIATVATTHSYTGPDGITRTKYVLKKRFTDGSEEKVEEDRTVAPRQQSGVSRITEV